MCNKYIMQISIASLKGFRDHNEDHHTVIMNLNTRKKNVKNINLFGIYDGHGGKDISHFLSENLPNNFLCDSATYPLKKSYVDNVYNTIQDKISKNPKAVQCGSTAILVMQYEKNNNRYLNIINLGDCKAVLCKNNLAIALTRDHRPMWPDEKTRIQNLGGKIKFDGDDWRIKDYSVSRSFGDLNAKPFMSHTPDLYKYKLHAQDKFIVIACDGLWDYMTEQDVINYINDKCFIQDKKNYDNIKTIASDLANFAIKKKNSTDNVSIIIVFF